MTLVLITAAQRAVYIPTVTHPEKKHQRREGNVIGREEERKKEKETLKNENENEKKKKKKSFDSVDGPQGKDRPKNQTTLPAHEESWF